MEERRLWNISLLAYVSWNTVDVASSGKLGASDWGMWVVKIGMTEPLIF